MMSRRNTLSVLIAGAITGTLACSSEMPAAEPSSKTPGHAPAPTVTTAEVEEVSLVRLLAEPQLYHGKLVRVVGFCRLEFEGNALFLHEEDFDRRLRKNALWLNVGWPVPPDKESLSDEYVVVEGVFDGRGKGHDDAYSGELRDLRRMERWPSYAEVDRMLRLPRR